MKFRYVFYNAPIELIISIATGLKPLDKRGYPSIRQISFINEKKEKETQTAFITTIPPIIFKHLLQRTITRNSLILSEFNQAKQTVSQLTDRQWLPLFNKQEPIEISKSLQLTYSEAIYSKNGPPFKEIKIDQELMVTLFNDKESLVFYDYYFGNHLTTSMFDAQVHLYLLKVKKITPSIRNAMIDLLPIIQHMINAVQQRYPLAKSLR